MKVVIDRAFEKDIKRVKDPHLKNRLKNIIIKVQDSKEISDIPNLKKLKGQDSFYRIRLGDYRIGCELVDSETISLIRFLHRKDIYKNLF